MIFFIANHASVLIGFLASLVVPTFYHPADFGIYILALTIAMVSAPVGMLRTDVEVLRASDDIAAAAAFTTGLGFLAATSLLYACGLAIASYFGAGGQVLLFLPVYTGVGASYLIRASVVKRGCHRVAAAMTVGQTLGMAITQLAFGRAGMGASGLLMGDIISRVVVYGVCIWWCHPLSFREARMVIDRSRVRLASITGLSALNFNILQIIAVPAFGSAQAGQLAQAQRFGNGLNMLIGIPATQTYQARLAAAPTPAGRIAIALGLLRHWGWRIAGVAALGTIAVLVVIPFLARWYGPAWSGMVPLSWVILPFMALQAVISPLSQTYLMLGEEGRQLRWDAARTVLVLALAALSAAIPMLWFLALYALLIGIMQIAYGLTVIRFLRRRSADDA